MSEATLIPEDKPPEDKVLKKPKKPVVKKEPVVKEKVLVSVSDMCKKHKWNPKLIRAKLRTKKVKKPGSVWAWPTAEAAKIEKLLKG